MAEFQVRVASEVIYYFDQLKQVYGDNEITRSQILMRAFEETKSISDWTPYIVDETTIPLTHLTYLGGHGTNIKVQISDVIEDGIRNLKFSLPTFTKTRSVTLGVTVKYILKADLILNKTDKVIIQKASSIDDQIEMLQAELSNLVANVNHDLLIEILEDFKKKMNSVIQEKQ